MIAKVFPTINNIPPYRAKQVTPYHELYTYDTPYSVKSHGPTTYWFAYDSYSENPDFTIGNEKIHSSEPFVKFYSGQSYPDQVSPYYHSSNQFGVYYVGYFKPETTTATFYLKGSGRARLQMSGGVDTGTIDLGLSRSGVATIHVTGLTTNRQLLIKYISPEKSSDKPHVFAVTWEDSTTDGQIPLAAGNYLNLTDHAVGISGVQLTKIGDVNLDVARSQISKLSFEIPVVATTASKGYKYVPSGDYFESVEDSSKKIRKFRMVEFNAGYKYSDGSIATVQKFSGQIRGWSLKRGDSGDVAVVECYDWLSFLGDTLNQGYPNVADYLIADYLDPVNVNGVAGDSKPRTYDGWHFSKAVESILYNGYIDPQVVKKKRAYVNVDDNIVEGYYLFHELNSSSQIRLEKSFKYGNPLAVSKETADSKYIWQFSIGSSLSDNLEKLMGNYGFVYGFNNRGYFDVKSIKNPVLAKSVDDFTYSGTWTEHTNSKMVYGVSRYNSNNGDAAVATFTGSNVRLLYNVGPAYGTIHVRISNPTLGMVATLDIDARTSSDRYYYDGLDDQLGYNPCELVIGEGFKYGFYSLNFVCTGPTISINSIFVNDQSHFTSVDTVYSGDSTNNGVLVDGYDLSSTIDDIRNDVVVVGRLKGVQSQLSTTESQTFNPNNPVTNHVLARAIDRVSIGSISNTNYTGRKLQTIIIDPNIATEERANWLATETVKRYNSFNKSLSPVVNIIGNPLYEVGDRLTIKDIKIDSFPTIRSFWLEAKSESWNPDGAYTNRLTMSSFEPWESYFKYPVPSLGRFNNNTFVDVEYYNFGLPMDTQKDYTYLSDAEPNFTSPGTIVCTFKTHKTSTTATQIDRLVPDFGYIKIKNEVIEYRTKSVSLRESLPNLKLFDIDLKVYKRGLYNTATIADISSYVNLAMELQFNPYMTEDFDLAPSIKFDLVAPGYVKVGVFSSLGDKVDVLTGNETDPNEGWVYLEPGTYYYIWGCLDRFGVYNEANTGYYQRSGSQAHDYPYTSVNILGEWYPFYGPTSYESEQYKPGADRYVVNRSRAKYGQFYLDVKYQDRNSEVTNDIKIISGAPNIHTVMRITGNSIPSSSTTDGIHEEFIISSSSDIDDSTIATLWWSNTLNQNVQSDVRPLTASKDYRRFYTGNENDGLGAKITLTNKHAKSRIVDIEVKRYIFTFLRNYKERRTTNVLGQDTGYALTTTIDLIDKLSDQIVESGGYTWRINESDGIDVYIKTPPISFITPQLNAEINQRLYEEGRNIGGTFYKDKVISLAVSHLHCFEVITKDFSGFRQKFRRSMWWVSGAYHNTQSDFSGTPKKPFDGETSAEKMVFEAKGLYYSGVYKSLTGLPNGSYPVVVVDWDSDHKNVVFSEGIYGVLIYGDYL